LSRGAGASSGGSVTLWRGLDGNQLQALINNGNRFLEEDMYLTHIKQVAVAFAGVQGGGAVYVTINAAAFQNMLASGLIRMNGTIEVIVPKSAVSYFNSLYTAVQIL
jgi:hypothetical protein